nr:unnamed protein product [Callosobruchus analis]
MPIKDSQKSSLAELRKLMEGDEFICNLHTDDVYLLRYLECVGFDPEKAFEKIKAFYTFLQESPKWFALGCPTDKKELIDKDIRVLPKEHDKEGRPIYIYKLAFTILQKSTERDACEIYGEHVAMKLRSYSKRTQIMVQHLFNNILFNADMGQYDNINANYNDANPFPRSTVSSPYPSPYSNISNVVALDDFFLEVLIMDDCVARKGLCVIVDIANFPWRVMKWLTPHNIAMCVKRILTMPIKEYRFHEYIDKDVLPKEYGGDKEIMFDYQHYIFNKNSSIAESFRINRKMYLDTIQDVKKKQTE